MEISRASNDRKDLERLRERSGYVYFISHSRRTMGREWDYVFPESFGSRAGTYHFRIDEKRCDDFEEILDAVLRKPEPKRKQNVLLGGALYAGACVCYNHLFGADSFTYLADFILAVPIIHGVDYLSKRMDAKAKLEHEKLTDFLLTMYVFNVVGRSEQPYDRAVITKAAQS
jgi:hypothetical protein